MQYECNTTVCFPCSERETIKCASDAVRKRYEAELRAAKEDGKAILAKLAKGEISPREFDDN